MTQLQQYWDEAHVRYSQQDWIDKPSLFFEQIIDTIPANGRVLDLAAGQGQDARAFAKRGYSVVATDISEQALVLARDKATAEGLVIDTLQSDLLHPFEFEDNAFDIVYSHLGLHYFCKDDTVRLLKEIHRVLKPNGVFATLLNTVVDPQLQEYGFEEVEPHYFRHLETGVCKSYFSVEYMAELTHNLFTPILLDANGISHKDDHQSLIRFVGRKIGE